MRRAVEDVRALAAYLGNKWLGECIPAGSGGRIRIEFNIPSYGYTGGAKAIVDIANMLSRNHSVSFVTTPTNILNRYIARNVRLTLVPDLDCDVYVMESGSDLTLMRAVTGKGAQIVVSSHGFPSVDDFSPRGYGYSDEQVFAGMSLATSAHFLSRVQREAFRRASIPMPADAFIIPNAIERITKVTRTASVGIVGDTTLALKNVARAVAAAEMSDARDVHVWGRYTSRYESRRATWHGFKSNKAVIFNSFDVLVSLSTSETQPLIVLEAMSAGIPCVLADLPCYEDMRGVDGFWFVDPHDVASAAHAINAALKVDERTRSGLIDIWRALYSPDVVGGLWNAQMERLRPAKGR